MSQGRGAYPCPTAVHDIFRRVINFAFHLHRLLFLMRYLHPQNSEIRTAKVQRNEISLLYVENKTQAIRTCMRHKSGKPRALLSTTHRQRQRLQPELSGKRPVKRRPSPYSFTWSRCSGNTVTDRRATATRVRHRRMD